MFLYTNIKRQPLQIIKNGVLDLNAWDLEKEDVYPLSGKWEFYFQRLLSEQDFEQSNIQPDLYVEVPSTWNTYKINNITLPNEGYATYRIRVNIDAQHVGDLQALRIQGFPSAYRLFINENEIASNGKVSTKTEDEIASFRPLTAVFAPPSQQFNIIIQVSNYHFSRGGLWSNIYFGSVQSITDYQDMLSSKQSFIIGTLVILSVFYFCFFLLRKEWRHALYFALLCLLTAVVGDFIGQNFLTANLDFAAYIRVWYTASCLIPFLFVLYVYKLFHVFHSKKILIAFLIGTVLSIFQYLLLPTNISTLGVTYNRYFVIAEMLYMVTVLIVATKKRLSGALLYLVGLFVLLIVYLYDNLLFYPNNMDLGVGELVPFGVFLMACIQSIILTKQFNTMYIKREQSIKKAIAVEIAFLQAQIKPHFLYNALSAIANVCETDGEKASNLIVDFSYYLRSNFEFNNLNKMTTLDNELRFIKNYIHIEKARYGDKINYIEEIGVTFDTQIPILLLEPLVENAVQHGISKKKQGGIVTLFAIQTKEGVLYKVQDNGVGMNDDTLKTLFDENSQSKSVGLKNIFARLKGMYGDNVKLNIESKEGIGTTLWFVLPHLKEDLHG